MISDRAQRWLASPAAVSFAIAIGVFLAVALAQGEKPFYYDSGTYWSLSDSFVKDGSFSFLNFENTGLRGYALPLVYFVLREVGGIFTSADWVLVAIFNSTLFALIGAVLAPRLAQIAWPTTNWSVPRRLAICALFLVFWRGYLSYPLSDFPALAAALLALVAIRHWESAPWMLVAGLATGLALNFRPAYVLLIPIVFALGAWEWNERGRRLDRRTAAGAAMLVAGLVLISLPQSLSQHRAFDEYTPIPGGSSLVGLQYTEGLRLQRYDTYVGSTVAQARMTYVDHHTDSIVLGLADGTVKDTGQYAEIVLENPITMAGVFLRHVINGLDHRYSTPYIEHLQDGWSRIWRFLGFALVFLALIRVAWPRARRRLEPALWRYPIALLLTCATSLASAVETRFLLPIFLLGSLLVLSAGWPNPIEPREVGMRRYRAAALITVAAIAFFAMSWMIVSDATDSLVLVTG